MAETTNDDGSVSHSAREAVRVFENAGALEAAVDKRETSGFGRAAISVLASANTVRDRLGNLYAHLHEIQRAWTLKDRPLLGNDRVGR